MNVKGREAIPVAEGNHLKTFHIKIIITKNYQKSSKRQSHNDPQDSFAFVLVLDGLLGLKRSQQEKRNETKYQPYLRFSVISSLMKETSYYTCETNQTSSLANQRTILVGVQRSGFPFSVNEMHFLWFSLFSIFVSFIHMCLLGIL